MTNHSPAPWKRDGFEIRDADGNLLAITVGESVDVEVANGNLMTAAPAMLAALETILESRKSGWEYIDPALEAMWGTIEEAVATAAGQTEATRA